MNSSHVFISHTTTDDSFVKQLRDALTARGLTVWDDARYLRGGDQLWPEVAKAIEAASYFIVVFSQQSLSSNWVFKEFQLAQQIEVQRKAEGKTYRVIPLLLDEAELGTLQWVFPEERAVTRVSSKPGSLAEKMRAILAALNLEFPDDASQPVTAEEKPVAELLLELRNLKVETEDGKTRAKAEATLSYQPPETG
ncbi:MAG: toll/interleukin-1 receptor domain-containing protein, partial [Blastocatellia bacterium]